MFSASPRVRGRPSSKAAIGVDGADDWHSGLGGGGGGGGGGGVRFL